MIIRSPRRLDRIRLIAIETMKGAFGNEGALRFYATEGVSLDFLLAFNKPFANEPKILY